MLSAHLTFSLAVRAMMESGFGEVIDRRSEDAAAQWDREAKMRYKEHNSDCDLNYLLKGGCFLSVLSSKEGLCFQTLFSHYSIYHDCLRGFDVM